MVETQFRLLTEGLKVNHLRLVMGTSMGGMHTWVWGEAHPEFMDALMPLASLPTQISGRNRVWRRMIIDAIQTDPEWHNGDYQTQPHGLRLAAEVLYFMGNNPVQRQKEAPTLTQADRVLDTCVENALMTLDANNVLYALEASHDYDPAPHLGRVEAPLLAVNFADDLINPPRAWHPGVRDKAREAGPGNRGADERTHPGPRHPYSGSGVEGASGGTSERVEARIGDHLGLAARDYPAAAFCRFNWPKWNTGTNSWLLKLWLIIVFTGFMQAGQTSSRASNACTRGQRR